MSEKTIRCPSCGGAVHVSPDSRTAVCPYCDNEIVIEPPESPPLPQEEPAPSPPPAPELERPPSPTPVELLAQATARCQEAEKARSDFLARAKSSSDSQVRRAAIYLSDTKGPNRLAIAILVAIAGLVTCMVTYFIPLIIGVIWAAVEFMKLENTEKKLKARDSEFARICDELAQAKDAKERAERIFKASQGG